MSMIREELWWETMYKFMGEMARKLQANSHKPGWKNVEFEVLMGRLEREIIELREAIETRSVANIVAEAADVANFAMFIADLAWEEINDV